MVSNLCPFKDVFHLGIKKSAGSRMGNMGDCEMTAVPPDVWKSQTNFDMSAGALSKGTIHHFVFLINSCKHLKVLRKISISTVRTVFLFQQHIINPGSVISHNVFLTSYLCHLLKGEAVDQWQPIAPSACQTAPTWMNFSVKQYMFNCYVKMAKTWPYWYCTIICHFLHC